MAFSTYALNFTWGVSVFRILIIALVLAGCTSSKNLMFYHPEYGVVDRNNEKYIEDSKQCALNYQQANAGNTDTAMDIGQKTKEIGEQAIGNVIIGTTVIKEGFKIVTNQSACMVAKGWSRVGNARWWLEKNSVTIQHLSTSAPQHQKISELK